MKLYRKFIRPMHCYPGQNYEPREEPVEKEEKWYPEEERERLEQVYGYLNEGHFSDLIFEEKYEPYDNFAILKEQEAKTGHWVSVNDGDAVAIDNDGFPERACFCSECKKYLVASDEYAVYGRYCPYCGAKMEGW